MRAIPLMIFMILLAGCNLGSDTGFQGADASPLPTPVFIRVDYAPPQAQGGGEELHIIAAESATSTDSNPTNLPQAMVDTMRRIYNEGVARGNRPGVFSKVGDSITVSANFLTPIGHGQANLAGFGHLQPVIDHFGAAVAREGNAFANPSLAAGVGWAAWGVLNPEFVDTNWCFPGETPLACEYRVVKPTVALIMFGTNDSGYRTPGQFRADMESVTQFTIDQGIIPILSTIPNRPEMPGTIATFNQIIGEVAAFHGLPVWDYHAAMSNLPNSGLTYDNVHPSSPANAPASAADFSQLSYGYVVRNLTALQMLDVVMRVVG